MAKPFPNVSPLDFQAAEGREIDALAYDLHKAEMRLQLAPSGAWNDLLPEKRKAYRDRVTLAVRTGRMTVTMLASEQAGDALLRDETLGDRLTLTQARHAAALAIETWVLQVTAREGAGRLE